MPFQRLFNDEGQWHAVATPVYQNLIQALTPIYENTDFNVREIHVLATQAAHEVMIRSQSNRERLVRMAAQATDEPAVDVTD